MTDIIPDLDATIASAVTARIEAEVARALSGDEVIGRLVTAALSQPVATKDRYGNPTRETTPYLRHVLATTIRAATKDACQRFVADEAPLIEEEVRKALKREAGTIAGELVKSLTDAAEKTYGVNVTLNMPGRG